MCRFVDCLRVFPFRDGGGIVMDVCGEGARAGAEVEEGAGWGGGGD